MRARVLTAPEDAVGWRRAVSGFGDTGDDLYFQPEWALLNAGEGGAKARLFFYSDGADSLAYPFLDRPVAPIGASRVGDGSRDIETAYGYGGPLSTTDSKEFLQAAWSAFGRWCAETRVVAEFVRFHPLLGNERWIGHRAETMKDRATVSMALGRGSRAELPYPSTARNMIRRSLRVPCTVEERNDDEGWALFRQLYLETMDRKRAEDSYYFDERYFEGLREITVRRGFLLTVESSGTGFAAAVFLRGARWLHYHLSGARGRGAVPGSMNLLLHNAAVRGAELGLERLHLGGGASRADDDPLLRFKASMGTDRHEFWIAGRVHDAEAYRSLREAWRAEYPQLWVRYCARILCYRYRQQSPD